MNCEFKWVWWVTQICYFDWIKYKSMMHPSSNRECSYSMVGIPADQNSPKSSYTVNI